MAKYEFSVTVSPRFLAEQSDPENERYLFAYTIRIVNSGDTTAQLVSRHWIITDANQHVEEVRGPGVVGEQPRLAPGEAFEYTSGCPLPTPFGSMRGSYQCVADDGTSFDVPIPEFLLSVPRTLH
ncbi:MAG: Co2+/Mg2+ efflux protein ApaG [Betaproteobacteria bacterium]|jgi:ApaG protein|nr:MAG: Co2+/Mg2+ efflux protein ApaG [Betaproteobacteria bacterium]